MKNRFRISSGALALTLMLLFSAVAFGHTASASMANPNTSASAMVGGRNEHWRKRRHRRHMRRQVRRERRGMRRELKKNP
jgi:hypothetical protein